MRFILTLVEVDDDRPLPSATEDASSDVDSVLELCFRNKLKTRGRRGGCSFENTESIALLIFVLLVVVFDVAVVACLEDATGDEESDDDVDDGTDTGTGGGVVVFWDPGGGAEAIKHAEQTVWFTYDSGIPISWHLISKLNFRICSKLT